MKKFLFLSMFPIMAMSVSASPATYLTRHTFMAGEKPQVSVERSHLPQTAQIPSRADDCHLVTISGDLDRESGEIIGSVYFWEDDFNKMATAMGNLMPDEDNTSYSGMVPDGTYDVMIGISNPVNPALPHKYIFRKDVKVNGDMTVDFTVEEAANKIMFNTILPDGSKAVLPMIVDNGEGKGTRDLASGNADLCMINVDIINKKTFSSVGNLFQSNYRSDGSIAGFPSFDVNESTAVYINDEFPDYMVISCTSRYTDFEGNEYATLTYTLPAKGETLICNDVDRYRQFSYSIAPSRLSLEADEANRANDVNLDFGIITCGQDFTKFSAKSIPGAKIWASLNPLIEEGLHIADLYLQVSTTDYKEMGKFGNVTKEGKIFGPPVVCNNGEIEFAKINNAEFPMHYLYKAPEGGYYGELEGYIMCLPTAPGTFVPVGKREQAIGESVPVTSILSVPYYDADGNCAFLVSPAFVGRCGEQRTVDMIPLSVTVNAGDTEVFSGDLDGYQKYMFSRRENGEPLSSITTVMTNENAFVDEMIGRNVTTLSYNENNQDQFVPSLQYLMFKTADGTLTDRFDNAADGVMEFFGGDFSPNYRTAPMSGYKYYWYEETSADVKVEYAPYGEDTFSVLDVMDIPELRYMPGFGHFYRGKLDGVNRGSTNGWYDLRITLTDAAGNEMSQLLSPAFNVRALAGIKNATIADEMGVSIDGRDIIAPAGAAIYNISGVRMSSGKNVAPGVYIVEHHGASVKVFVK